VDGVKKKLNGPEIQDWILRRERGKDRTMILSQVAILGN
jgi:hypothetical protein